jgi:hypothetical protein
MTAETGGPAFPHTVEYKGADCGGVVPHGGMTLRDYFASKAMQSLVSDPDYRRGNDFGWIAERSYHMADAMLKARKA